MGKVKEGVSLTKSVVREFKRPYGSGKCTVYVGVHVKWDGRGGLEIIEVDEWKKEKRVVLGPEVLELLEAFKEVIEFVEKEKDRVVAK